MIISTNAWGEIPMHENKTLTNKLTTMEKINVKNLSSEEAAALIKNKYPHLRVVNIESDNGMDSRKGLIGFDSYEEAKSILDSLDLKLFDRVSLLRTQNGHRYENYNPYMHEDIDVYQCMIEDHVEGLFCYKEDVLKDYRYILEEEEDPNVEEKVNSLKQKLDDEDFDKCMYRSFGDYDDYEMIEKYSTSYWSERDGYSYHLGIDLFELDYD